MLNDGLVNQVRFKSDFIIDGKYSIIINAINILIDNLNKDMLNFSNGSKNIYDYYDRDFLFNYFIDQAGKQIADMKLNRNEHVSFYINHENLKLIVKCI